jgi:ketosteroid isomerase-like protein
MVNRLTAALQPFLGIWRLDPGESRYTAGPPPRDGAYTISGDGAALHFAIEWTAADGQPQQQTVAAIPDGQPHPYAGPGVDAVCYTLVDAVTLDSTALKAGEVVAEARRVLRDADSLEIVQGGRLADGSTFANRALYRRAQTGEQAALLLLERFNRRLNAHDVAGMMALMTADCVFENTWPPPDGTRLVGQEAVTDFWRNMFAQAPAANIQIEELVVAGERAFGRWVYRWGAGAGDYVAGVDIFRIAPGEGGRIAEKLSYVKG